MTEKPTPLAFQPAPRPQPRMSVHQRAELAEATRDLGFGRTTSSPADDLPPESQITPPPPPPASDVSGEDTIPSALVRPNAILRFDIPEDLLITLRHEAVTRRASVKYLILEALAAKGYDFDLSAIPEDGRRRR